MNKKLLNMLMLSFVITIFGFLLDDDIKEPSTIMRFVEFFAMTAIIFTAVVIMSYIFNLIKKMAAFAKS